jgi:hypothetical protein
MSVGFPLYQEHANTIANTLEGLAKAIREEPETFTLQLMEGSDGTEYYDLKLHEMAGPWFLELGARARETDVVAWEEPDALDRLG